MTEDDQTPAPQPQGMPSPGLQAFRASITDPRAQPWADEVVAKLNNHFQQRRIADEMTQEGQAFTNNMSAFKNGLVGMVQKDPTAVHVAMDLVPSTIATMITTMPGGPPTDAKDHYKAITGHMQSEIAAAAVTRLAEQHEGIARATLADPRIDGVLDDGAKQGLGNYISLQAHARNVDAAAAQRNAVQQAQDVNDRSTMNYVQALIDPGTGKPQFPPAWTQAVMADPKVSPASKIGVMGLYNKLQESGDAPISDPHLATDLVGRMASGEIRSADVLHHAGDGLRVPDALAIAGMPRAQAAQLSDTLQDAQTRLSSPDNGYAGYAAFSKFVNWMLPAARNGAVLDPNNKDYILANNKIASFMPTAADLPPPAAGPRPPLAQIFAENDVPRMLPADELAARVKSLPTSPGDVRPTGPDSGTFFQRKLQENPDQGQL